MKADPKNKFVFIVGLSMMILITIITLFIPNKPKKIVVNSTNPVEENKRMVVLDTKKEEKTVEESIVEEQPKMDTRVIAFDNLTFEELSAKLDRSLNSTLTGKGNIFAKYALELNVDPYLAVAIALEETGCKWNCSALVNQCNNVGGQKGGITKCGNGSYRYYPTLDEGIYGFIDNLSKNYISIGLVTPEQINTKYAASKTWSAKINNYIAAIKQN